MFAKSAHLLDATVHQFLIGIRSKVHRRCDCHLRPAIGSFPAWPAEESQLWTQHVLAARRHWDDVHSDETEEAGSKLELGLAGFQEDRLAMLHAAQKLIRVLTGFVLVLTAATVPGAARGDAGPRPEAAVRLNIISISDDHAALPMSGYGSRINSRPNLDRIRRRDVVSQLFLHEFHLRPESNRRRHEVGGPGPSDRPNRPTRGSLRSYQW